MRAMQCVLGVLIAAVLPALAPASATAAQESTHLTITVLDECGARVADAAVVLSRSSEQRADTTGRDGSVIVRGLATGAWTVDVSRDGFVPVRRPVVVQSTPVTLTVTLEVGGIRQNVIVEASRP